MNGLFIVLFCQVSSGLVLNELDVVFYLSFGSVCAKLP